MITLSKDKVVLAMKAYKYMCEHSAKDISANNYAPTVTALAIMCDGMSQKEIMAITGIPSVLLSRTVQSMRHVLSYSPDLVLNREWSINNLICRGVYRVTPTMEGNFKSVKLNLHTQAVEVFAKILMNYKAHRSIAGDFVPFTSSSSFISYVLSKIMPLEGTEPKLYGDLELLGYTKAGVPNKHAYLLDKIGVEVR